MYRNFDKNDKTQTRKKYSLVYHLLKKKSNIYCSLLLKLQYHFGFLVKSCMDFNIYSSNRKLKTYFTRTHHIPIAKDFILPFPPYFTEKLFNRLYELRLGILFAPFHQIKFPPVTATCSFKP